MRTPTKHLNTRTGETYYRIRYRREGKQRAATFYGETGLREAENFARLIDSMGVDQAVRWWNANLDREPDDQGITLDEWWPRYLRSLTRATEGTRVTYDRTYARVWQVPLGHKPLTAITREDVAAVINELSQTKSDKTVKNAYGVLTSCLKTAVHDGHMPANPITRLPLPRRTEHLETEMRFLDHDEWELLLDSLPEHYRPLFTTLVGTGMRWGEAEALLVGDVVLSGAAPVIRVTKSAKWDPSKATRTVGPTKTKKSRRSITLPPQVVDAIAPLLDRPKHERLFLAPRGGELRHRTVYDEWKKAVQRSGLTPQPRIHDLRHTQVAWLIAAGIPLPVIKERLGHENISTTIDRYGHLLPDLQVAAANAASVAMMRPSERRALTAGGD